MKVKKKEKQKDKYERYKLASIPILLCVLAYVLWVPSKVEEESVSESPEIARPTAQPTGQATTQSTLIANTASKLVWPEVDLQFLSQSSPFANYLQHRKDEVATGQMVCSKLADSQPPAADQLASMGRELSQQTVDYVFRSNARKIVRLGEKVFEQGEYLSDSVQLHEIQQRVLILKLAEPEGEADAASIFH